MGRCSGALPKPNLPHPISQQRLLRKMRLQGRTQLRRKADMTIQTLIESGLFTVVNRGADTDRAITSVYCCDLLSVAMGHAPAGSAWVTVMGNINTLAVVALTDAACVVLAGGAHLDEATLAKARQQQITVLATDEAIFEAALAIHQKLHD